MSRKVADCRDMPSEKNCTIAISGDNEDEVVSATVEHAISVHGAVDSPELRNDIKNMLKDVKNEEFEPLMQNRLSA